MQSETKLFNRFFICTLLIALCINFAQAITANAVSVYIDSINLPASFTGIIGIPYAILAILSRIISGYYADNKSRRLVMVFGCLVFALSTVFFGFLRSALIILIVRALQGAGYAFSFTGATAANVDVTPKGKEKEGVGIFWVPLAIATAVSGQLILMLSKDGTYTRVFLVAGLLVFAGVIFSLLCNYEKTNPVARSSGNAEEGAQYHGIQALIEPRALKAASIMLTYAIGIASVTAFVLLFASIRGYQHTGAFFMISAICMFIGNLTSAKLHKALGAVGVLGSGLIPCAAMLIVMAFSGSEVVFLLTAVAYGYLQGIASPVLCSLVMEELPADRRGAGSSTLYMMLDIGIGIGSFVWGVVIDGAGYTALYCGAGIIVALAFVLTLVFYARKKSTNA